MKWSSCVALSLPLALTAACATGDLATDDLATARARWRDQRIDDYSFDYRTTGFAPPVDARVVVVGGQPVAVENHRSDFVLALDLAPTIESLFNEVDHTRDMARATIQWDPALGFPATAHFEGGSEWWGFEVSAFSPGR